MKDLRKIKKYANVFIDVSNSNGQDINTNIQDLISFKNILKQFPELRYLLLSKQVSLNDKIKSIKNIFNQYYKKITIEFISLLIENNNMSSYNDIIGKILSNVELNSNTKKIHITSHKEYSRDEQLEIMVALKDKFNISDSSKTTFGIDPQILGGIKVRIGNKILDGSVSTKLKKIKESLLSI